MSAGIARQASRNAKRMPDLMRSISLREVWARTRGHVAGFRQLLAWQMALRRMQRQQNRH